MIGVLIMHIVHNLKQFVILYAIIISNNEYNIKLMVSLSYLKEINLNCLKMKDIEDDITKKNSSMT